MGFHDDAIFPSQIAVDSTFGWGFQTAILESSSGAEQRVARRESVRHVGDVGTGVQDPEQLLELKAFHLARRGALYGFRFKDPLDHLSNDSDPCAPDAGVEDTDQILGTADGVTSEFQLVKRYASDNHVYLRKITKPIEGTLVVAVGGSSVPASSYSVSWSTGVITFDTPPNNGAGNITAGFEFHTPVRFDSDADKNLEVAFQEFKYGTIPAIGITEILDDGASSDEFWYGGSAEISQDGGTLLVTSAEGRFWKIGDNTNNQIDTVILPNADELPTGGPHFYLYNAAATGASNGFDIVTKSGTPLVDASVAQPGTLWMALLYYNQSVGNVWTLVQG